jgi:hypothetical protein
MSSPINVLNYLQTALAQDQIAAVVTQNPDGTLLICVDVGPGSSSLNNAPLVGSTGASGADQFVLLPEPDIFGDTEDLPAPGVLQNSVADLGKFWMIAQQDENGNYISVGAYIWYGSQFRFLPFGSKGPMGPYPVIKPFVELLGPEAESQVVTPVPGAGSPVNPYLHTTQLAIPEGPPGEGAALATFYDFEPPPNNTPVVGQFITATGVTIVHNGQSLPVWTPQDAGAFPLLPYIVPQSAFFSVFGIEFGNLSATISGSVAQLTGFVGTVEAGLASVLDGAITTLSGGTVSRGNTTGGVASFLAGIESNVTTLMSAIGSSLTGSSPLGAVASELQQFVGTITTPIQNAANAFLTSVGLGGLITSGATVLQTVANSVTGTIQAVVQAIENALSGTGIPTIGAFTVPAKPWPWKPLVFGSIRMFEIGFSLQPLQMGIEVTLGWPGGNTVARGFGGTLSGVVNIMPHTSWPGNPSYAMTPWNSVAYIPANTPGALFVNVVNDGIISIYDYNAAEAQLFVMACPVTTQAQLMQTIPGAMRTKAQLSAQSITVG